jgi:poly-beta-1,6 N-acetyl-D-glucosamine synthase
LAFSCISALPTLEGGGGYNEKFINSKISYTPTVSIVIPAYNEELVLHNCISSLLNLDYKDYKIIIVDDGSTDKTPIIGRALARKHSKVSFTRKKNAGKALALNHGIKKSNSEIIVCIDADSNLKQDALWHLTLPFADLRVGAVGGNVKVVNRERLLNRHQAVEYIVGLNIQRRAFSHVGCMQVISGAIGAFRKDLLLQIGGYSNDTLVENMDITIAVSKAGYDVIFAPQAIAYTEAPESIKDFFKQRYRWTLGGFKIVKKYREMIFNKKYGAMGMIGLPYFMFFPWIDVSISLLLVLTLIVVAITGNYLLLLLFLLVMLSIQATLVIYALRIDRENWNMVFLVILENIWYSHLINYITVKAGIDYLRKKDTTWNKVTRFGKNKTAVLATNI